MGIVVSAWNAEITHALRDGALEVLRAAGVTADNTLVHEVPELLAPPRQWLMEADQPCDAVIAIGTVIRGETAISTTSAKRRARHPRVGLDTRNPTIFCVLTDDTIEQSRARSGGEHGNKGVEAAVACLQMLDLKSTLYGGPMGTSRADILRKRPLHLILLVGWPCASLLPSIRQATSHAT